MTDFRLALVCAALLGVSIGQAHAAAGMLSVRSAVHEGAGNEFKIVGYVDAGRFDYGECRLSIHDETWCYVEREADPGWINVVLRVTTTANSAPGNGDTAGPNSSSPGAPDTSPPDGHTTTWDDRYNASGHHHEPHGHDW